MHKTYFPVLALFLILPFPGESPALTFTEVAERVERTYGEFENLEASFVQESRVAALGGRTRHKEGRLWFLRPGRMRWEYEKPERQLIVADGMNLWYYRPRQKQVIVRELDGAFSSQTPLLFLFGRGRIAEEFSWDDGEAAADADGIITLDLKPKEETPELTGLKLLVRHEAWTVAATVIRDAFGNETRLEFSDEKPNTSVDAGLFLFEPPPGTEVISP